MSTRATYQIKSGFSTVTFYIHHDGYFSGAASYFKDTLDLMRISGRPLLPCFLWANKRAYLTDEHEAHGDTEYRYDIERRASKKGFLLGEWFVAAYKRKSYDSDVFEMEWSGSIHNFVIQHAKQGAA